ncbi:hypothetical protein KM043_005801 [Ampulex compressa]|nr:hypothetical protein KM043_005801 [Ampulex compressa]
MSFHFPTPSTFVEAPFDGRAKDRKVDANAEKIMDRLSPAAGQINHDETSNVTHRRYSASGATFCEKGTLTLTARLAVNRRTSRAVPVQTDYGNNANAVDATPMKQQA